LLRGQFDEKRKFGVSRSLWVGGQKFFYWKKSRKEKQIMMQVKKKYLTGFNEVIQGKEKQGGKGVLVLPNTKDMTRSTKWV